jgi:hypothetical protein
VEAASDNMGVTSYEVWQGDASYEGWVRVGTLTGSTLAHTVHGLSPLTTYTFGIRAFDAAGTSRLRQRDPRINRPSRCEPFSGSTGITSPTPVTANPTAETSWRRSASFETDLDDGYGRLEPPAAFPGRRLGRHPNRRGRWSKRHLRREDHSTGGNDGCSCPRMKFEDGFNTPAGEMCGVRGSWYFPNPSAIKWSRMMNLSSYTGKQHRLLHRTGHRGWRRADDGPHAELPLEHGQKVIFPARPIPVGRWFTVVLHFKLSPVDGQALNEWYVDGQLVGSNTVANMVSNQALNTFQAGMPYFLSGVNTTVYFDNAGLKD